MGHLHTVASGEIRMNEVGMLTLLQNVDKWAKTDFKILRCNKFIDRLEVIKNTSL